MKLAVRAHLPVLFALLASCSSGSDQECEESFNANTFSELQERHELSLEDRIDQYAQETVSDSGPGLAVLIMSHGEVVYKHTYGLANIINEIPITADTGFRLASISKTFTALAIMQLYERGQLVLSDPILDYLPELPPEWIDITIHHLLSHRSGIPDYINDIGPGAFSRDVFSFDVVEYFTNNPDLEFSPGLEAQYSNSGYLLLAQIVARASGMSFSDYMYTNIFQPAGMNSSYIYDATEKFRSDDALGDGSNHLLLGRLWLSPGAISQVSSLTDLENFYLALMSGQLVSDDTLKKMTTPYSSGIFGRRYGYGFLIHKHDDFEFGHEGLLGGFVPGLRMNLTHDWYVVVLNNGAGRRAPSNIMKIVSEHFGEEDNNQSLFNIHLDRCNDFLQ